MPHSRARTRHEELHVSANHEMWTAVCKMLSLLLLYSLCCIAPVLRLCFVYCAAAVTGSCCCFCARCSWSVFMAISSSCAV